jgi:hypothetical protein
LLRLHHPEDASLQPLPPRSVDTVDWMEVETEMIRRFVLETDWVAHFSKSPDLLGYHVVMGLHPRFKDKQARYQTIK